MPETVATWRRVLGCNGSADKVVQQAMKPDLRSRLGAKPPVEPIVKRHTVSAKKELGHEGTSIAGQ
eukprot:157137-Rhodomonas_salina.1